MKHAKLLYGWIGSALVAGGVATPILADEMYSWTDENGVKHFSSMPPPPGHEATVSDVPDPTPVPTVEIDIADAENADSDMSAAMDSSAAESVTEELSAADQQRLEMAEKRAQRRAAQAKIDNACAQARMRLAQIEPSRRVFYTNEAGEAVRMDDEERIGEIETLNDFISSTCD